MAGLERNPRMDVVEADESRSAEWDAFVAGERTGGVFHLWSWRPVFEHTFDVQPRYLLAEEGGSIRGVLSLVSIRQWSGRRILSSLFGGVCSSVPAVRRSLLERAKELAADGCSSRLFIRDDPAGFEGLPPSRVLPATILPLPREPGHLWRSLDPDERSAVRKARRGGMVTDEGPHYLPEFHRVYARNMRDLGTPALPFSYLEKVLASFPGRVEVIVAKKGGAVAAGMVNFAFGGRIQNLMAASLLSSRPDRPMDLLYWTAIEGAIGRGFAQFDMGRSQPGSGTHRFKQKWGGEDVELRSYEFRKGKQTFPKAGHGRAMALCARLWRLLPLWAAGRLGPIVRRRIPMG